MAVIGFAAWLANLGGGGGGVGDFNYPDNRREDAHKLSETIGQIRFETFLGAIKVVFVAAVAIFVGLGVIGLLVFGIRQLFA